jgi:tight adherence protein C
MVPLIVFVLILLITAAVLVIIGLRNPKSANEQLLMTRLDEFSQSGEQVDLEKLEMSQPFVERVIYPLARKLGEFTAKFTPQNWLNSISKKLELGGNPGKIDPSVFLVLQFAAAIGVGGFALLTTTVFSHSTPPEQVFLLTVVGTLAGFFIPQYYLSRKVTVRQKSIRRAMPDALDLLTICVEAGLGFDAAMAKVVEKWTNQLSVAFNRVLQEVQLGKLRREALRSMAENIGITEMTSFVAAVIQSEQLGVSMAKVLRIQADQMRVRRRQLAEEEAHKAPIKMLLPMAFIIFPSLLIILLTPALFQIINSGMFGG